MNNYCVLKLLIFTFFLIGTFQVYGQNIRMHGKVIDKQTLEGIPFVHIFIEGTRIGAISDLHGNFTISYSEQYRSRMLQFSCLGYKPVQVSLQGLNKSMPEIRLEQDIIQLQEVVVTPKDPLELLGEAFRKIPENYDTSATMLSGYYKMSSVLGDTTIRYTEAFLDIFKPPLGQVQKSSKPPADSVHLRQVRTKPTEIKDWKLKTMLDWENSPHQLENRDVVKDFSSLNREYEKFMALYDFEIEGLVFINKRRTYKIGIKPKKGKRKAYWNGALFLDEETLAFVKVDFVSTPNMFRIFKSALGYKLMSSLYKVRYNQGEWKETLNYRLIGDKWYFNEVNSSKQFLISSKKRNLEEVPVTVTVQYSTDSVKRNFSIPDSIKFLSQKGTPWWETERFIESLYDPDFWDDFDLQPGVLEKDSSRMDQSGNSVDNDSLIQETFIKISATLLDESGGSAIGLAHISLKGTAKGTVSNDLGQFDFKIPVRHLNDTLVISSLGYRSYTMTVAEMLGSKPETIHLKKDAMILEEIVVSDTALHAREIVQNAIKNIANAYPGREYMLKGFYRDWFIINIGDDSTNASIAEAALSVYDKGYSKTAPRSMTEKIYVDEVRLIKYPGFTGNNFAFFFKQNPVKYRYMKANMAIEGVLDLPNDLEYKIENVMLNENREDVYVISACADDNYAKYTLYISVKDLAILRIDLNARAPEEGYIYLNPKDSSQEMKSINNTIRFRRFEGVPYLSYMRQHWTWEMRDPLSHEIVQEGELYTEFMTNDVITDKKILSDLKKQRGRRENAIFEQQRKYNAVFWNNYNFVKSNPLNKRLEAALNQSVSSLEERFGEDPEAFNGPDRKYTFTKLDTLQGTLTPLRTSFDVGFYHLDVEVFPVEEVIRGSSLIRFRVVDPMDRIQIDLYSEMSIDSITFRGRILHFEREFNAVYIDFPETLPKGSVEEIIVFYSGHPVDMNMDIPMYGSFLWLKDDEENPWLQAICQGYGASGWWPNKDHLSDEPDSAAISITVPADLDVVSNGRLRHKTSLENGKTRYDWFVSYPINNYNLTLNAGKYTHFADEYVSGTDTLDLDYYVMRYNRENTRKKVKMVKPMLQTYEKFFGKYPFPRDGFKLVETPHAMEHQSCVSLGYEYFSEYEDYDFEFLEDDLRMGQIEGQIVLHETAHEWWGNSVSCTDNAELWIHEAFATYAEALYIEDQYGYEKSQLYLSAMKDGVENEMPIIGKFGVNHIHYNINDMYLKGAVMLNTLRHVISNDSIWFSILKGIPADFRYKTITTEDVVQYVNQKTGTDYTAFFDQYLRTTQIPTLELMFEDEEGKHYVKYRWATAIKNFSMPVQYTIGEEDPAFLYPTLDWQKIQLPETYKSNLKVNQEQFYLNVKIRNK